MNPDSLALSTNASWMGAAAFVITTIHLTLSFPLLAKAIETKRPRQGLLIYVYVISGILTGSCWLLYLLPLQNLFVETALCLQILLHAVLIVQIVWLHTADLK